MGEACVAIKGRGEEGLIKAKQELGYSTIFIQNDSSDVHQQHKLAETIKSVFPRIDVHYINAGDVTHKSLDEWDEEGFDRVINTNLKGPFFLILSLLPILSDSASIILCGSVSAQIGLPKSSVYSASKAGLISLARTLSGELKHLGIRVNTLSPGPTQTEAFDKFGLPDCEKVALINQVKELVPLKRLGTPLELAKAAVFLASDESAYMLGSELLIDGGVGNL